MKSRNDLRTEMAEAASATEHSSKEASAARSISLYKNEMPGCPTWGSQCVVVNDFQ
jgi:hypothetical protein